MAGRLANDRDGKFVGRDDLLGPGRRALALLDVGDARGEGVLVQSQVRKHGDSFSSSLRSGRVTAAPPLSRRPGWIATSERSGLLQVFVEHADERGLALGDAGAQGGSGSRLLAAYSEGSRSPLVSSRMSRPIQKMANTPNTARNPQR